MTITEDLLIENGFKIAHISESLKALYEHEAWIPYTYDTNEGFHLIITKNMSNYLNRNWSLHIDNEDFETIGSLDCETTEQFNFMMEAINSSFRL